MNESTEQDRCPSATSRRAFVATLAAPLIVGCLPIPSTGPQPSSSASKGPATQEELPAVAPAESLPSNPPSRLKIALDQALNDGFFRKLSMTENGAWQVLHGVLAYGQDCLAETPQGLVRVVDYLRAGGKLAGFSPLPGDLIGTPAKRRVRFELEGGSMSGQGHRDQWLAILSQCGIGEDAEFQHDDLRFSMSDAMEQLVWDVPRNVEQEYSWTLINLSRFRPTDFSWTARDGAKWSVERILQVEANAPLESAACGGTHRLISLGMALETRRKEGAPMSGAWAKAEDVVMNSIAAARSYQNGDGSFSTTYLYRYGWSPDLSDVLRTTGHVLEFLSIALDQSSLDSPWVEASAMRLCDVLKATNDVPLECGALYHALHGVILYRQRRFPDQLWQIPQAPSELRSLE